MSDKDVQQDSNVTEFPSNETSKATNAPEADEIQQRDAEAEEKAFQLDLRKYQERQKIREKYQQKRTERFRRTLYTFATIFCAFNILLFVSLANPSIYAIDMATLAIVNQAINAVILLLVPFFLGMIGAAARIMIATVSPEHKGNLLISSGLMATFSWIGIKSGVLISIIAPHLERSNITAEQVVDTPNNFYTMALVAVFVGMFSINLYLLVAERVEHFSRQNKTNNAD